MTEQVDLLHRLTSVVAQTPPGAPLPLRLCLALTQIVGLEGGTMTVGFDAPTRTTLCSTDDRAERIEELQDVLREGPGLDAYRLRTVVNAGPEEVPTLWPVLAQSIHDLADLGHLVAAPMRPNVEVLGVLTLYGTPGQRPVLADAEVQFLADAIGVAVLGGFERSDATAEAWSVRDVLNQATGMVVAQLQINPGDALALLRAHAYAHDAALSSIAADVVSRRLDFRTTNAGEMGDHDDA